MEFKTNERKKSKEEIILKRELDSQKRQASQIPDIPSSQIPDIPAAPVNIPPAPPGRKPKLDINRPPPTMAKAMDEGARRSEEINKPAKGLRGQIKNRQLQKSERAQQRQLNSEKRTSLKARAKKGSDKTADETTSPVSKGTAKLLRAAWTNLIQSFGLTLIWINIHVFLRFVFGPKIFCKLGQEWLPEKAPSAGGGANKALGNKIGLAEWAALLILDFIVISVIVLLIVQQAILVYALLHPVDFFKAVWQDAIKILRALAGFKD